jgi:gamma-glutamyl:cysteine ligase YbdK (ATP-grasp superfamily)
MKRPKTNSPQSRYRYIPTENIKFEKFMELISKSKMEKENIRDEIVRYVKTLETNYTDTIKAVTQQLREERHKFKKLNMEKVADIADKN